VQDALLKWVHARAPTAPASASRQHPAPQPAE
jgi:hypothetical protein